jgi:hypothetical protein
LLPPLPLLTLALLGLLPPWLLVALARLLLARALLSTFTLQRPLMTGVLGRDGFRSDARASLITTLGREARIRLRRSSSIVVDSGFLR